MAVFLVNICKFKGCGVVFPTLNELIHHIEDSHLDFKTETVEKDQFPACLPISYILRVFSGEDLSAPSSTLSSPATPLPRKDVMVMATAMKTSSTSSSSSLSSSTIQPRSKLNRTQSPAPSFSSITPTGSEMEEDTCESESEESSIDSWSTKNADINSIRGAPRNLPVSVNGNSLQEEQEKPYACHIDGCRKRYRNPNGLKYHSKSAHSCIPSKEINPKIYKCQYNCSRIYKTAHGLRNHELTHHAALIITEMDKNGVGVGGNNNADLCKDKNDRDSAQRKANGDGAHHQLSHPEQQKTPKAISAPPPPPPPTHHQQQQQQQSQKQQQQKHIDDTVNEKKTSDANSINITEMCPIIRAPTLQQHLLSPLVAKITSKC